MGWASLLLLGSGALVVCVGLLVLLIVVRKPTAAFFGTLVAVTIMVAFGLLLLFRAFRLVPTPGLKIALWVATAMLAVMLIVGALGLIWRFFAWLGQADPAGAAVNPEERKRILGMVEQGKMTGTEGTELLNALGKSSALRGQQTFGRLDVCLLVGVAIVAAGFFLPWVYLQKAEGQNLDVMNDMFPHGIYAHRAGYHGVFGWAVLVCSMLAAALVFVTPKDYLYKLVLLQVLTICAGLGLMFGVWWLAGYAVGPGTIVCCLGFAFALIAGGMKLRALGR